MIRFIPVDHNKTRRSHKATFLRYNWQVGSPVWQPSHLTRCSTISNLLLTEKKTIFRLFSCAKLSTTCVYCKKVCITIQFSHITIITPCASWAQKGRLTDIWFWHGQLCCYWLMRLSRFWTPVRFSPFDSTMCTITMHKYTKSIPWLTLQLQSFVFQTSGGALKKF